ncbi:MAG TPA: hypothetical protein VGV86_15705 [Acidimicrobiales bacterium]|nr:hypothetical protein [Acidimicrobiales bacterium]
MPEPEPESYEVVGIQGRTIALPLPIGPPTGHRWILDLPEGVAMAEDSPARAPEPGREAGAAHGGTLQVTASPGRYNITARLARPWSPDDAVRVVNIDLIVD